MSRGPKVSEETSLMGAEVSKCCVKRGSLENAARCTVHARCWTGQARNHGKEKEEQSRGGGEQMDCEELSCF